MTNSTALLTPDEIQDLAAATLAKMTPDELTEAVAWLNTYVIQATNGTVQRIMFSAWLSTHDRFAYEMTLL